jgi:hypothetical protein
MKRKPTLADDGASVKREAALVVPAFPCWTISGAFGGTNRLFTPANAKGFAGGPVDAA